MKVIKQKDREIRFLKKAEQQLVDRMKGTLSLESTVQEELDSVRKLRQEILDKAEDIEALEAVIETEGFFLDQEEKDKYARLRDRV